MGACSAIHYWWEVCGPPLWVCHSRQVLYLFQPGVPKHSLPGISLHFFLGLGFLRPCWSINSKSKPVSGQGCGFSFSRGGFFFVVVLFFFFPFSRTQTQRWTSSPSISFHLLEAFISWFMSSEFLNLSNSLPCGGSKPCLLSLAQLWDPHFKILGIGKCS